MRLRRRAPLLLVLAGFGAVLLSGCALLNGESTPTSTPRPPLRDSSTAAPVATPTVTIAVTDAVFQVEQTLEVHNTGQLGLRVRASPAIRDDNVIGKLFDGTIVDAEAATRQAGGYTWRRVRLEGWAASNWFSPQPAPGLTVQVRGTQTVGLRIRTTPEIQTGNMRGKVYDGTWMEVLDGPRSANNYQWWRVSLQGWSAIDYLREIQSATGDEPVVASSPDRRFIVLGGMCSTTIDYFTGEWMPGLKRWLSVEFDLEDRRQGDPDDQVIEFSYSSAGWKTIYSEEDTFGHIPDVAKNLEEIFETYPSATFDIMGHSLGGAVALYFVATADDSYRVRTNSVITVDSPVNGIQRAEFLRLAVGLRPGCPDIPQVEGLAAQLEPGSLVPSVISRVTKADWSGPTIITVTNTADLVVPVSSATLEGPSVYCRPVDENHALNPPAAHNVIVKELPRWFRNLVGEAYAGRLGSRSC